MLLGIREWKSRKNLIRRKNLTSFSPSQPHHSWPLTSPVFPFPNPARPQINAILPSPSHSSIVCPEGYETSSGSRNRCQRSSLICARDDQACLTAPLSYSHNFLSFPSKIRIPADLFTMRGPFSAIQRLQFDLRLLSAKDPLTGDSRVTRDFFYLKHFRDNEAVVSLLRQIDGPQDVELELEMKIFTNGRYSGTAVAKIFLYVTKNEF